MLERGLWGTTVLAVVVAVVACQRVRDVSAGDAGMRVPVLPSGLTRADTLALEVQVETVIELDLFQPERAPVEDAPAGPSPSFLPSAQISASRPRLQLRGLVGGPPWDALIEGVPGRDGAVLVRTGESVGGLTVRAIRRDTVFIRGSDTTWTLTLSRP